MHYFSVVALRTLAVVVAVWTVSLALHQMWKSGDMLQVLVALAGLLVGYGLWWIANRKIERQGRAIPF